MTIFEFVLLRAARQRMTQAELETAQRLADRIDAGESGYAEILRKMVVEVLYDRNRKDIEVEEMAMPPRVLE